MKVRLSRNVMMAGVSIAVFVVALAYLNVYWSISSSDSVSKGIDRSEISKLWLQGEWSRIFRQEVAYNSQSHDLADFTDRKLVDSQRAVLSATLTERSLDKFDPWGKFSEINVWDLFPPQVACPDAIRLGNSGDGGKWICGLDWLQKQVGSSRGCLIYSFGVSTDISFEVYLHKMLGCEVHAFDPTVGKLPIYQIWPPSKATDRISGIYMHKVALSNETGSSSVFSLEMTLQDIMHQLNHSYVDILKVDVEGAEWKVFKHLFRSISGYYRPIRIQGSVDNKNPKSTKSDSYLKHRSLVPSAPGLQDTISKGVLPPWTPQFGQILIELHHQTVLETANFFTNMFRAGYLSFSREVNLMPTAYGNRPAACEYSFINPHTFFVEDTETFPAVLKTAPAPVDANFHKPIKAVIYFLSQRKRLDMLKEAIQLLYDNYWLDYGKHYPVLIFHDDFGAADQSILQKAVPLMKLRFITIKFQFPKNIDPATVKNRTHCDPKHSTIGYRHMCRFHATVVHDLLKQHGYNDIEYIMRLDDDSRITHPIGYDWFQFMKVNNKLYGYVKAIEENVDCITGLWDLAGAFFNRSVVALDINRTEVFFDKWPDNLVVFNNFEISHVSVWNNPVWKGFMSEVDEAGGIYSLRWGDAPIHTIGISMTLKVSQVHAFSDIGYYHHMLNQTAQGLPRPNTDPFAEVKCVYYDRWICGNFSNSTNATYALAAPAWGTEGVVHRQFFFNRIGAIASPTGEVRPGSSLSLFEVVKGDQRGVLYTFAMQGRDEIIANTLISWYNGYTKSFQYPIVVFYSLNSVPAFDKNKVVKLIGKEVSLQVQFVGINTKQYYPKQVWKNISSYVCIPTDTETIGIMKFLTFDAIQHLSYMGYEWFFRFDEDSFFLKPLTFDVFQHLVNSGKRAGFLSTITYKDSCWDGAIEMINQLCYGHAEGLSKADAKKVKQQCANTLNHWPAYTAIMAGFQITHISVWKTPICNELRSISRTSNANSAAQQLWPISFYQSYCIVAGVPVDQIERIEFFGYKARWFFSNNNTRLLQVPVVAKEYSHYQAQSVKELNDLFLPRRFGWLGGDLGYSFALPTVPELLDLIELDRNFSMFDTKQLKVHTVTLKKYVWLFADSLIGTSSVTRRLESVMISNSVGIASVAHNKRDSTSSIKSLQISWGQSNDGTPKPIFSSSNLVITNFVPNAFSGSSNNRKENIRADSPAPLWPFSGITIVSIKTQQQAKSTAYSSKLSSFLSFGGSTTDSTTVPASGALASSGAGSVDISMKAVVLGAFIQGVNTPEEDINTHKLVGDDAVTSFVTHGSAMFVVNNPHESPSLWEYSERIILPDPGFGNYLWLVLTEARGNAFARDSDLLYLLGSFENTKMSTKSLSLAYNVLGRISAAALLTGSIHLFQVACQKNKPSSLDNNASSAQDVEWLPIGQCQVPHQVLNPRLSEPSFYFDEIANEWVAVGVELTMAAVRKCSAKSILGPYRCSHIAPIDAGVWTEDAYITYAGKAHPELRFKPKLGNRSPLIVSYTHNPRKGPQELFSELNFGAYVPRFVSIETLPKRHKV